MPNPNTVMLPANVRPVRYELTLAPNLDDFTFEGEEAVDIEVLELTSSVVLNCAEIAIQSSELALQDGSTVSPSEALFNKEEETVTLQFSGDLPVGPARLRLEFTGELNDKLHGFYRSRYTDESGAERHLATTQFEATDARRAFPCWDEPALKATFKVTLRISEHLVAVSNMPATSEIRDSAGGKRVEFAESPVMSTYLLAFIVGDLKSIERRAQDGTLVRVWTTAGNPEQGRFAVDVSARLLAYFNDYFGVPYPLEKMDHLAIPDFAAGAMENWGAITYRETALLVDPENSSALTRQRVASVVSHEMAHMWFGDLVTMAWWSDLWLNESFASFIGDKAVDHLFPEWDMWTQFVSEDTNRGLSLDGLRSSHPIEQEVNDPAQISELFDAISYSKGGAVLRMLEEFLGADAFREGLRRYISRHQYGNARTRDLWDALGEASGEPVAAMMHTWTAQTGYPVVEVETDREADGIRLTASQKRFVYEHIADPDASDDALWHVPLSATAAGHDQPGSALMKEREGRLALAPSDEPTGAWIKVNPGQTGFYRVSYSPTELALLRPAISGLELPAVDRLGVQNDTYALSRAGYVPATEFLSLAEAYAGEVDATVWSDLAANLGGLGTLLADEPFYGRFEAFGRTLFRSAVRRVGWVAQPGEGHLDALLRSTVLGELGGYGDEDTLVEAQALFQRYLEDPGNVHPDIRRVVLHLAAKQGDRSTYEGIWQLQKKATLEEEKVRLLSSLAQFEVPQLLQETLERSLDTADVRSHDTVRLVSAVASNRLGRDMAWDFVKSNWPEFDRRYGDGKFALMQLVSITSRFTTAKMHDDVEGFFKTNPSPGAERTIRQSLERIRLNVAWLVKNRQPLAEWFAERE